MKKLAFAFALILATFGFAVPAHAGAQENECVSFQTTFGGAGSYTSHYLAGGEGPFSDDGENYCIYGSAVNDIVLSSGTTFFEGNNGNDTFTASAGVDDQEFRGDNGTDVGNGNDGGDILYGGSGNDHLYGEGGDDLLFDGMGVDYINGGAGDDTLYKCADGNTTDTILNVEHVVNVSGSACN